MNELTSKELEMPRTASQLLPWAKQRMNEIGSTDAGGCSILFRQGLTKRLVEELLPLGIFASHHFGISDDVTISPVLGNQNHDASVEDRREKKSPIFYIEVTQAHDGESEYLRMLVLKRDGSVSALGAVHKSGTKATGIHVEVKGHMAQRHSTVVQKQVELVKEAMRRKMQKDYEHNTALLVVFDDWLFNKDGCDRETLRSHIQPLLSELRNFRWFAVVGWSELTFLEFDLARTVI